MTCAKPSTLIERGVKQGCLISCANDSLSQLTLSCIQESRAAKNCREKTISVENLLLVLSQDCDINQPNDPYIEVLALKKAKKRQEAPQLQKNRNYRKLQIQIEREFWICEADLISVIPKGVLADEQFRIEKNVEDHTLEILLDWRIGRYKRRPLPDKFNQDFLFGYLKNPDCGLDNFLQQHNNEILDLYAYVTPNDDQAKEYMVSVTALLAEGCSLESEKLIADHLIQHWEKIHRAENALKMVQIDTSLLPEDAIDIPQSVTLRMSDFTLWDATKLRRITLDYLCYDED